MEFRLNPELVEAGYVPTVYLDAELVEAAIIDFQTFGPFAGLAYRTIIDLCCAGF